MQFNWNEAKDFMDTGALWDVYFLDPGLSMSVGLRWWHEFEVAAPPFAFPVGTPLA